MTITRAEIQIESTGRFAYYESEAPLREGERVGPALIVEVDSLEEALAIVETLNRSKAQRKKAAKEPAQASAPGDPPSQAEATGQLRIEAD